MRGNAKVRLPAARRGHGSCHERACDCLPAWAAIPPFASGPLKPDKSLELLWRVTGSALIRKPVLLPGGSAGLSVGLQP
ncbi:Hypothetical predicted protein [Podarcis lilfordi]|uniref:Uncharacterized protein n=1 Tax=Podarcis lilfordi TaxID=74358 RepID=A0AA35JQS8_9SAUR|nr:Hypothetical predicted protein [Podarcis lilfordi]